MGLALRRRWLVLAALVVSTGAGAASSGSAEAFVKDLYAHYSGGKARGVRLDTDAAVRRYFAPELADAIRADFKAAAKKNDVPNLDGDPFVDAQDWKIEALRIGVAETAPDQARATVRFTNLGTPRSVELQLVKLKAGWRIREVTTEGRKLSVVVKPHR